eukprot:277772-Prymnesium_polylepis.1
MAVRGRVPRDAARANTPHLIQVREHERIWAVRLLLAEEICRFDVGEHEEREFLLQLDHDLQHLVAQVEAVTQ